MNDAARIPDSELEIMMIIWDAGGEVNTDYITARLERGWARPTLLKLLDRLCERGFLKCRKDGRLNMYTPTVEKELYLRRESKSFLKKLHHNSVKSLIASLYDGGELTKSDINELEEFISGVK